MMDESGPRLIYHKLQKNKIKSNTKVSEYQKECNVLFCKKYLMFLPISLIAQLYMCIITPCALCHGDSLYKTNLTPLLGREQLMIFRSPWGKEHSGP